MPFRPTTPSDLDRALPLLVADPACDLTADTYRSRLADGEYRPAWTWIAEDDAPGAALPDAFDATTRAGKKLLRHLVQRSRYPTEVQGCRHEVRQTHSCIPGFRRYRFCAMIYPC
ncbi:hypothetical protein ACFU6K_33560 [Kitasatospora sp. NPDC057512]|uniref:hypothetical protein n=1 Tax=Kitasatospora sp. NPDC057512 TaxID=3346154 RepID=UPI0036C5F04C